MESKTIENPDTTTAETESESPSSSSPESPSLSDPKTEATQSNPIPQFPRSIDISKEDTQALRKALSEQSLFRLSFYFLDYILRAQSTLFEQIYKRQDLPKIIAALSVMSTLLSGIYGLTMGMNHSIWQTLASALKLPILFMITAVICIPSLYTFNVLLGQQFRFLQTVALMVMTLGTTTILLASLAPLSFFFGFTTQNYYFLMLMHVAIFGLCGVYGVRFLYRGCAYIAYRMEHPLNQALLRIWILIYGIVGMQLGWRLRPFVGYAGSPFQLLREEQEGNFYLSVWNTLLSLLFG